MGLDADVIALQEYDCDTSVADYRGTGRPCTFREAMAAHGYDGLVLLDAGKREGQGLYWRRDVFSLGPHGMDAERIAALDIEAVRLPRPIPQPPPVGRGTPADLGAVVFLADMGEHWHKRIPKSSPVAYEAAPTPLRDADHKSIAAVQLVHRATSEPVWVATTHLMTTSRDCAKTNGFPG